MQNNILTKIKKLIRRLAFLAVTLRKCKFIRTKTPYSL